MVQTQIQFANVLEGWGLRRLVKALGLKPYHEESLGLLFPEDQRMS